MTSRRLGALVRAIAILLVFAAIFITAGCKHGNVLGKEYAYVSAPQANLRDRLSAVYNKVGVIQNGQRVEILEKSKRFYRVRASGIGEGWVEVRYLVDQDTYDGFEKLAKEQKDAPAQSRGVTRAELNMHLTPARDGEHLFQMKEGEKVEVLRRSVTDKNAKLIQDFQQRVQKLQQQIQAASEPPATVQPTAAKQTASGQAVKPGVASTTTLPSTPESRAAAAKNAADKLSKMPEAPISIYEDWYLVRDSQKHVGWVLARMIDVDVPMEIAQYAEGKRIVAAFIINSVTDYGDDGQTRQMPQYLVLTTEPKDGQPFDYNGIRVFSWNGKRHRYETAYRDKDLFGVFPVTVGHENFDKEGDLPTFVIHSKDDKGQTIESKYKMNGPIVSRVLSPAEQAVQREELAKKMAQKKADRDARIAQYKAAHGGKAPRARRRH